MIQNVTALEMPIDEEFRIVKNHITHGKGKRICIVTGTHGDELEGQYVCYLIAKMVSENKHKLSGTVDIYPALNPLGIDTMQRGVPAFDLDMNRIFPGNNRGSMIEKVAHDIYTDLSGADMVIDIHASNIFLREMPQVRISETTAPTLVPYARMLGIDFIWVHQAATVLESTLAHSLNSTGTPCLVAEMAVGGRISHSMCQKLTDGIQNLMFHMGIWSEAPEEGKVGDSILCDKGDAVAFLNAQVSGIFTTEIHNGVMVREGQLIGQIISPLTGKVLSDVLSPCNGLLFTIRAYPVVYEGSLLGRIYKDESIQES
ncbi:MAG: M14 family metallopeptidase [Bacteroidaceae bacterium]|nr:M14 family metallopeptidase [Bacteroidaceae bacterium]